MHTASAEVCEMICDKCNEIADTCRVDWFLSNKKPQYRRLCYKCWRSIQYARGAVRGAETCGLRYD